MGTRDDDVDRREEVERPPGFGKPAEQRGGRRRGHPRRVVVGEPADVVEQPEQEELRGERGDREVEPLDAQARQPEQDPDQGREQARDDEARDEGDLGQAQDQVVAGVGADRHEPAGAQRDLPGVAGEQVQPQRGQPEHEELGEDRPHQVLRAGERGDDDRERHEPDHEPVVLANGEDRLVAGVGGLELACFAVEHLFPLSRSSRPGPLAPRLRRQRLAARRPAVPRRQTRSMIFSPNSPCGRTSRNSVPSMYGLQFSVPPPKKGIPT